MKLAAPRGVALRLSLGFGTMCALLMLVAALAWVQLDALNRQFSQIVVERHARTEIVRQVSDAQQLMMRVVGTLLWIDDKARMEAAVRRIDAAQASVGERLGALDMAFQREDARGQAQLREAHERASAYMVNLVRFKRLVAGGNREDARALLATQLEAQLDASYAAMLALGNTQTALMQRAQREARASYERQRLVLLALCATALLIAFIVSLLIARSVTRPLGTAVRVADAVAGGDLTSDVHAKGDDETARLLRAMGVMNGSLTRIVSGVRAGSADIEKTALDLVKGNTQLMERMEEQASSLEETAATLEELSSTVRQNAQSAVAASESAQCASQAAVLGGEAMARAVQRMDAIDAASRRIADISRVIDELAFQTNLLALNAAVEAAHAGDQGRGFAVVAGEVRHLADRSAQAAREVGSLIGAAVSEVREGSKLVGESAQVLQDVVARIHDVTARIGSISGASREQSEAIGQVNEALARIEQVTQRNVALGHRTSTAIESLEQQAARLVDAVGFFRVPDRESETAWLPAPSMA